MRDAMIDMRKMPQYEQEVCGKILSLCQFFRQAASTTANFQGYGAKNTAK